MRSPFTVAALLLASGCPAAAQTALIRAVERGFAYGALANRECGAESVARHAALVRGIPAAVLWRRTRS